MPPPERAIRPDESFPGRLVSLRLVTLEDCTDGYVGWLNDEEVTRYLETRWYPQTRETIRDYVRGMLDSRSSYLFAIVERSSGRHVGNLKIGPIDPHHSHADVSYFIGERSVWGRGYATDAIRVASEIAFERLGLHRLQAGVYEGNRASARALVKAGFVEEARFRGQLRGPEGWEDHLVFGLLRDDLDAAHQAD